MQTTRHLLGMDSTCIPKLVYEYITSSRRNIGRPRKGWRDQLRRKQNKPGMASTLLLLLLLMVMMMIHMGHHC